MCTNDISRIGRENIQGGILFVIVIVVVVVVVVWGDYSSLQHFLCKRNTSWHAAYFSDG